MSTQFRKPPLVGGIYATPELVAKIAAFYSARGAELTFDEFVRAGGRRAGTSWQGCGFWTLLRLKMVLCVDRGEGVLSGVDGGEAGVQGFSEGVMGLPSLRRGGGKCGNQS